MLGDNIKRIRKLKKISINKLSKLTGISLGYLSDLENNKAKNPTMDKLNTIAAALDVSADEFLRDDIINIDATLVRETSYSDYNVSTLRPIAGAKIIKKPSRSLNMIPKEFTNPSEARMYISRHQIFGSDGFDSDKMSDEEILEFANELLRQMELVAYKYKK